MSDTEQIEQNAGGSFQNLEEVLANKAVELLEQVEKGAGFVAGEIPLYIQELMMWYGVKSAMFFTLGLLLMFLSARELYYVFKVPLTEQQCAESSRHTWYNGRADELTFRGGAGTIIGILTVPFAFLFITCNLDWLQILVSPRVWLIEYLRNLV